jgi:hypothetical protein
MDVEMRWLQVMIKIGVGVSAVWEREARGNTYIARLRGTLFITICAALPIAHLYNILAMIICEY